jgi:fructose-1,6-bisphosphatase/inositol monophosphatase family enzyme
MHSGTTHQGTEPAASQAVAESLIAFVQEAGQLALDLRSAGLESSTKGEGLGQVLTEADRAISRMLHERFGARLIEEESVGDLTREAARDLLAGDDWTYIGDPIDGTAPYAGGLSGWGTMVTACRKGRPVVSAIALPAWVDERDQPDSRVPAAEQRGLLLAAFDGTAYWAPLRHGRIQGALRVLSPAPGRTRHVGWLPVAAQRWVLDYEQGFFPWCESGFAADAAALATGRLDATTFNHKLWDLAPALPILEALGFRLYCWPDCREAPEAIIELFDNRFTCHRDLWIVSRSREAAAGLAKAIRPAAQP